MKNGPTCTKGSTTVWTCNSQILLLYLFWCMRQFDSMKSQRVERLRRELFQIRHRIKFNAFQNQQCSHFFVQGPQFSFVCNAHWGVSLRNLVLYCYFLNQNMWKNQPKLPWRKCYHYIAVSLHKRGLSQVLTPLSLSFKIAFLGKHFVFSRRLLRVSRSFFT